MNYTNDFLAEQAGLVKGGVEEGETQYIGTQKQWEKYEALATLKKYTEADCKSEDGCPCPNHKEGD